MSDSSNKILVVYNTCGISGRENLVGYISSISTILAQKLPQGFDVVISSCMNNLSTKEALKSLFGSLISNVAFNFIDEKHPVNVTFNHSVMKTIEDAGEYLGYMYVDSGTSFVPGLLGAVYDRLKTGKFGMVTPQPENDTEYFMGLGVGRHRGDDEYARSILFKEGDYIIPIGKAMGTHTNVISNDLRKFYGKVYPDIFASHCTESTFSFLNAALGKQWLLMKDYILPHKISMDGQSSGFSPAKWIAGGRPTYDHPYKIESIVHRVVTKEAAELGFGYEECRGVLMHDPSQFDSEFLCKNDKLKHFIKDKLFLSKEELDYENINSQYIGFSR